MSIGLLYRKVSLMLQSCVCLAEQIISIKSIFPKKSDFQLDEVKCGTLLLTRLLQVSQFLFCYLAQALSCQLNTNAINKQHTVFRTGGILENNLCVAN